MLQRSSGASKSALVVALTLGACTSDEAFVQADIEAIAREDLGGKVELTIEDAWIGDGDAAHRDYYAELTMHVRGDFRIEGGMFDGFAMRQGDRPQRFTIELSYTWRGEQWRLTGRRVVKPPVPS